MLTSGRLPVSLELARIAREAGCRVVVAECFDTHLCKYSSAVDKTYQTAAPARDPDGFRRDLLEIARKEKVDLVLPACEEVLYVAGFADEFPPGCEVYCDKAERMIRMHDKYEFIRYVEELGFPVPQTESFTDRLPEFCATTDFVVKPHFSRSGRNVNICKAGTPLRTLNTRIGEKYLAQRKIEGRIYCTFAAVLKGKLSFHITYEPSMTNGSYGICFRSLNHARIESWVREFAEKTNWHGFLSFDFIEQEDGQFFPIECNPRPTSGIHMITASMLRGVLGHPDESPEPDGRTKAAPKFTMVGIGMVKILPEVLFLRPWRIFVFILNALRSRDVIFSLKDPLPALHQLVLFYYYFVKTRQESITMTEVPTYMLEWPPDSRAGEPG